MHVSREWGKECCIFLGKRPFQFLLIWHLEVQLCWLEAVCSLVHGKDDGQAAVEVEMFHVSTGNMYSYICE